MGSILKLTPLIREGTQHANGTTKSGRHFLDFVIDGESLWEAFGERHDRVSILCAEYSSDETAKAVDRLLLNGMADWQMIGVPFLGALSASTWGAVR